MFDGYLRSIMVSADSVALGSIEGYGITFDHFVSSAEDDDPETLMINLLDPADSEAAKYCKVDLSQYSAGTESVVLLLPRCCQLRRGTTDRKGINNLVKAARSTYGGSEPER